MKSRKCKTDQILISRSPSVPDVVLYGVFLVD